MDSFANIAPYEKLSELNSIYGIWRINNDIRVTFVSTGWLIVWDHRDHPPTRYDCKAHDHRQSCLLAAAKIQELTES